MAILRQNVVATAILSPRTWGGGQSAAGRLGYGMGIDNLRVFSPGHNLGGGEGGRKNLRRGRWNPTVLGRRLMAS